MALTELVIALNYGLAGVFLTPFTLGLLALHGPTISGLPWSAAGRK